MQPVSDRLVELIVVAKLQQVALAQFEAASFDVSLDAGCGMGFSAVHKVRAAACKALEEAILSNASAGESPTASSASVVM